VGNDGEIQPQTERDIVLFARTNYRNERRVFGIRRADRRAQMYVIGKTGTGKSTLLETLIRQDIARGEGVALVDPHGDLAEKVLAAIPEERKCDLLYLDPIGPEPLGFNPLENVPPLKRPLAAAGLLEVFKKIWADSWRPRLEHILRKALLALLDQPSATLADVLRLLVNSAFRRHVASRVQNPHVRNFWLEEYESYPARFRVEAIAPIQNKVGAFLANPILNRIVGRATSAFDVRRVIDEGKILIVNLAKGKIGEDAAALLGAMLVSKVSLAALSRAELPERARRDFYLYLDEFQSLTTLSLASMLSELRKYRVNMVLAPQYLAQLDLPIRSAILGNAGTIISFRVGMEDAEILAKEFYPEFAPVDLVSLPNYSIYLRLMVDGKVSEPFSAETVQASG
jgi:GTPase SAR1 family protein